MDKLNFGNVVDQNVPELQDQNVKNNGDNPFHVATNEVSNDEEALSKQCTRRWNEFQWKFNCKLNILDFEG